MAYGVIAGIISYLLLNLVPYFLMKYTNGKLTPPGYELAERWSVPPGGFAPLWMRNVARGNWRRFWEEDGEAMRAGIAAAADGAGGGKSMSDSSSAEKVHPVDAYIAPAVAQAGLTSATRGGASGGAAGAVDGHHSISVEDEDEKSGAPAAK